MFAIYVPKLKCYLSRFSRKTCLVCVNSIDNVHLKKFKTFNSALKFGENVAAHNFDFEIVDLRQIH